MPNSFTLQDRQNLLNQLQTGRQNAIGASRLAQSIGFTTRGNQILLRTLIKECIEHDGDLIGAATGRPAGFFKIASLPELERYLDSLEHRTRSNNSRRNALIANWNRRNPATRRQPLTIT